MPNFLKSLGRFLHRALSDLPSSIGSNFMGLWFPALPALLLFAYQANKFGWEKVKDDLYLGLEITIVSYAMLFIYCAIRNLYREHVALVQKSAKLKLDLEYIQNRPAWQGYDSEQAWRDSINFQNRLIEIGRTMDGVMTPLQCEVLKFSCELSGLMKLNPLPDKAAYGYDVSKQRFLGDDAAENIHRWGEAQWSLKKKVIAQYELAQQAKAREIYNRTLTETGIDDQTLKTLSGKIDKYEDIQDLVNDLRSLVFKIEDAKK